MLFRVRLFWGKMISGNHFPSNPRVWQQRKMKFSGKSFLVDQHLLLWPGNDFTLSFSLQIISRERERERERERAQIGEREREREEKETSPAIAPLVDRARRSRRSSKDRIDLAFTTQSHLLLRHMISIWPDLMNFFAGFCFFCEWVWNWFIICMFTVEEVYGKLGM